MHTTQKYQKRFNNYQDSNEQENRFPCYGLGRKTLNIVLCMVISGILLSLLNIILQDTKLVENLERIGLITAIETAPANPDIDDQRSTLWPILISTIVAMLGSLITSYIFLKDSLDRMVDEKPHYRKAVLRYRDEIINSLLRYMYTAFVFVTVAIGIYFTFYYGQYRLHGILRGGIIIVCVAVNTAWSISILSKCLNVNKNLQETAGELLETCLHELKQYLNYSNKLSNKLKNQILKDRGKTMLQWLQIELSDPQTTNCLDFEKYINRFSDWEKLLLLLVEPETLNPSTLNIQSPAYRIRIALQKTSEVPDKDIEDDDGGNNDWGNGPYETVCSFEQALSNDEKLDLNIVFSDIFGLLSDCRDFFLVQRDTKIKNSCVENKDKKQNDCVEDLINTVIPDLFAWFISYISIHIFRMLPRMRAFIPAEPFWCANFYNIRFEDSAFRASSFEYSIFARSKIVNSNFNMAKFSLCEFFSADIRNCSFTNIIMEESNLRGATLVDVDFTGANLENCKLEKTRVQDSILSNLILNNIFFGSGENDFSGSRISNVSISHSSDELAMVKNKFDHCSLQNIFLNTKGRPHDTISDPDALVNICLNFCLQGAVENLFWDTGTKSSSDFSRLVRSFAPYKREFKEKNILCWKEDQLPETKLLWDGVKGIISVHLEESTFENAEMPNCRFYRSNLSQCLFRNTVMNGVWMAGVILNGAILTDANLRNGVLCVADMRSCVLTNAILFHAVGRFVNLEDAELSCLHASMSDFVSCSFNRSNCTQIDLTRALLKTCSFQDAILTQAEMTHAVFIKVSFRDSIANEMLSSDSCFFNCDLTNALLSQSSLNRSTFQYCRFELANCKNSTVVNAKFSHCNFENSNFENTCFINVEFQSCESLDASCFRGGKFIECSFAEQDDNFKAKLREAGIEVQN